MKRLKFALLTCMTLCASMAHAQWSILPVAFWGRSSLHYPADNLYGIGSGGSSSFGLDVEARYSKDQSLQLGAGLGIRTVSKVDSLLFGSAQWIPVYVTATIGDSWFLEGSLGYNIPVGGSGLGYVTGWFASIGGGLVYAPIVISLNMDILHIFGTKTFSYVPNGYVAVDNGNLIGVKLKYIIPVSR
ncbi:MAG: hypothetical protein J6I49_05845 [Bacteroidales bacterium]|nr:hypothetical protein [Bacteroidales bacterium]